MGNPFSELSVFECCVLEDALLMYREHSGLDTETLESVHDTIAELLALIKTR